MPYLWPSFVVFYIPNEEFSKNDLRKKIEQIIKDAEERRREVEASLWEKLLRLLHLDKLIRNKL